MQSYDYAQRSGVREIRWNEFADLARRLAEALASREIECVVGIARAGLLPATTVAAALRCDLFPVAVSRREQDQVVRSRPVWRVDVSPLVAGRKVAVIDEMTDTGETLELVAERVLEMGAVEVITASLVSHSWAAPAPQVTALRSDALVIFPWDSLVLVGGNWQLHPELVPALEKHGQLRVRADGGPQAQSHEQRRRHARNIEEQLQQSFGTRLLAIGLYGSLARDADQPYSDIEMHCLLRGSGFMEDLEWCTGDWKAEVNVYTLDMALYEARQLDVDWSATHGGFTRIKPAWDPENVLPMLSEAALKHSDQEFRHVMAHLISAEIYEWLGKIRNAEVAQQFDGLPLLLLELAKRSAWLAGLENRHLYSSASGLFTEAAALPALPNGTEALLRQVIDGDLSEPRRLVSLVEAFWRGVSEWAEQRKLPLTDGLPNLLTNTGPRGT